MILKQFSSQELPNSSSLRETSCNRGEETAQDQPGAENTWSKFLHSYWPQFVVIHVCLSVHKIARLQQRGASEYKDDLPLRYNIAYKFITRRGIMDHPAHPLVTAPHFTVTPADFKDPAHPPTESVLRVATPVGFGYSPLRQPQCGCIQSVFSFPAPPYSSRLIRGLLELVPLSLSLRFVYGLGKPRLLISNRCG